MEENMEVLERRQGTFVGVEKYVAIDEILYSCCKREIQFLFGCHANATQL
jgi:hypothetical protein